MHDAAAGTVSALLATPIEDLDESALIRMAQKGDQEAFERLVREHDQSVLRLAMNLLPREEQQSGRMPRKPLLPVCVSGHFIF